MRFTTACLLFLLANGLLAQQWTPASGTITNSRIDDITFVNDNLAFAASGGGNVYRSTDGGINWSTILSLGPSSYFRAVEFLDESTGFISSLDGAIYKTEDGGDSWTDIASDIPGLSTPICGFEHRGDKIWGVGVFAYPATLITSEDRGETWTVTNLGNLADGLVEVFFLDDDTGFIGGISELEGGKILRTDDGGASWTTVFTSEMAAEYIWKIFPVSPDTLYASVENLFFPRTSIARSYDGGQTWTEKLVANALLDIQGIGFLDGQRGWVGPRNTNGFFTEDGGETWTQDNNFPPNINRVTERPDGTLFASGSGIFYYAQDTLISHLENIENYPVTSELKVFPNPVGSQLNYTLEIGQSTNYRLDIFGSAGNHLANLGSGRLAVGVHQGSYDIPTHYPSGNLYLVLRCDDNMMATEVARLKE